MNTLIKKIKTLAVRFGRMTMVNAKYAHMTNSHVFGIGIRNDNIKNSIRDDV